MHARAFLDKSHQIVYMILETKNTLEQVSTETLQEKAYEAIRDSIMRNNLLPGQPLLIDELARSLGVSPHTCKRTTDKAQRRWAGRACEKSDSLRC